MRRISKALLGAGLALLITGVTWGCGPRDRDAANGTLAVSDVTLGRSIGTDNRVSDRTTNFTPRDTIYAAVETDRSASGGTLAARWTYQDGQVVDESSRTIAANDPAVTEFHIVNPAGWPVGNYRLEVLVNGTVARTEEFRVQ